MLLGLAIAGVLAIAVQPGAQGSTDARAGGIFKVTYLTTPGTFDHVDPALAYSRESWALLDTVCARLMRYRDAPPPRGYQLVPDVAAAPPTVSADRRTWTFRLRSGFRFSNGQPVRADAFAQAIHRTMAPGVDSPGYDYTRTIVGAEDVHAGRATKASGVVARGQHAPSSASPARWASSTPGRRCRSSAPSRPRLQPSAEGVRAFPGAGPYYVKEYRLNRKVEIRRNRYYGGNREHHVDGFDVDLRGGSPDEHGQPRRRRQQPTGRTRSRGSLSASRHGLIRKYAVNFSRFWLTPGLTVSMFVLNSSRPALPGQPAAAAGGQLRPQQGNDHAPRGPARDRPATCRPASPAYRQRAIYPDQGDLARARELAAGNLRDGKAVFLVPDIAPARATLSVVQGQLAKIGLDVEIRPFGEHATASSYLGRLGSRRAVGPRARALVARLRRSLRVHQPAPRQRSSPARATLTRFDEPSFTELMRKAARLRGAARAKAYAELDLQLARDAAPLVPTVVLNEATLVSARVDRQAACCCGRGSF